jgi:predicted  nucleic acid-binding Zn-ribbon protein
MNRCVKVKYADEKTALAAIETIKRKSTRFKRPTKTYFCKQCEVWHLTSQVTREELRTENFTLTQKVALLEQQLADAKKEIELLSKSETNEEKTLARIKRKNDELFVQALERAKKANEEVKKLRSRVNELYSKLYANVVPKTNQNGE